MASARWLRVAGSVWLLPAGLVVAASGVLLVVAGLPAAGGGGLGWWRLLGGVLLVALGLAPPVLRAYDRAAESVWLLVAGTGAVLAEGGLVWLTIVLAQRREPVAAWVFGVPAGLLLIWIVVAASFAIGEALRTRRTPGLRPYRGEPSPDRAPRPPGQPVPLLAFLGALAVPVASVVWDAGSISARDGAYRWSDASGAVGRVVGVACLLAAAQAALLLWLRVGPGFAPIARRARQARLGAADDLEWFAGELRRRGTDGATLADLAARPGVESPFEAWQRLREDEDRRHAAEQERRRRFDPGAGATADQRRIDEEMARRQRFDREQADRQRRSRLRMEQLERREQGLAPDPAVPRPSTGERLRPLAPRSALLTAARTADETGLVVDEVWPRIEALLPEGERRAILRRERALAGQRAAAAGAACTAVTWYALGSGGGPSRLLLLTPLLLAAALVVRLREQVAQAYAARAGAVDVHRFGLARAMDVAVPEIRDGFAAVAALLTGRAGEVAVDVRLLAAQVTAMLDRTRAGQSMTNIAIDRAYSSIDVDALREQIAGDVNRHVGELVERRHRELLDRLPLAGLDARDLDRLAAEVARRAAEPVGERLQREVGLRVEAYLGREVGERVADVIRDGVREAVQGPPLVNFTGYVALELNGPGERAPVAAADRGTLTAAPGQAIELAVSVIRDSQFRDAAPVYEVEGGRPFLAVEPIDIQGGRAAPVVEFDAVVDSRTVTPLPRRRRIRVGPTGAQASFQFVLPDRGGRHELWFQLYQAGRLIQVVALAVEATAAPEPG